MEAFGIGLAMDDFGAGHSSLARGYFFSKPLSIAQFEQLLLKEA